MPRVDQLDNPEYFPYRYGQALWAYVAGRWGDEVCARALRASVRGNTDAEHILEGITGLPSKELSKQWHEALQAAVPAAHRGQADRARLRPGRDHGEERGRAQRRARAQPRRQHPGLLLREGPLLDRPLPGRRAHGGDPPQAREDGDRPAFPEPAVHQLRGQLRRHRPALRVRRGRVGQGRAQRARSQRRPRPRLQDPGGRTRSSIPASRRTAGRSCSPPRSAA